MENEAIATVTWGYWVLGILQAFVFFTLFRLGRLVNTCKLAQNWADQTQSLHHDIPEFADKLNEILENVGKTPVEVIGTIIINFIMIHYISEGEIPVMLQIFAAVANATIVIMYLSANRLINEIMYFVYEVETINSTNQETRSNNNDEEQL